MIALLQKGSVTAFEKLFKKYGQRLYRFSHTYLKSEAEAEDVVQEVFLKLWENRTSLRTGTSFQSYLFTIAFNAIQKNFNKRAVQDRFRVILFENIAEQNSALEDQSDFEFLLGKLDLLIDQMPSRRKEIFLKRKKEGKSVGDIAIEMDISKKTVENQITEAMNYLRKSFSEDKASGELFFLLFIA